MQPETIKVNGQTLNGADIVKKELTPVQQWDQLAFQVIYNEIYPKGFRKVKNGKYRGSEYVEMPKKAVTRVQRVGAQLVRGFREKVKQKLQDEIVQCDAAIVALEVSIKTIPFYMFKHKAETEANVASLKLRRAIKNETLQQLDLFTIK